MNIEPIENGIDFILDVNDNEFENSRMNCSLISKQGNNRYLRSRKIRYLKHYQIRYDNAVLLANEIRLDKNERFDCIVSGNFIFGDFIEAFIVNNNVKCKVLVISTLSLDQNNVDSLSNLIKGEYVDSLSLIISDYFFSHERRSLIPYIYDNLDLDNKFQLAVAGSHMKVCLFETLGGKKIIIHGSANLRSSNSIEQFVIEENESLYNFMYESHLKIIETYSTINKAEKDSKSLRGKFLWNIIN